MNRLNGPAVATDIWITLGLRLSILPLRYDVFSIQHTEARYILLIQLVVNQILITLQFRTVVTPNTFVMITGIAVIGQSNGGVPNSEMWVIVLANGLIRCGRCILRFPLALTQEIFELNLVSGEKSQV